MKTRLFILLLFFISATCVTMTAQTPPPPPDDIPLNPPGGHKPKGLTETPVVYAFYTNDTLTVSITDYYGDVIVTVEDAVSGIIQTTQTEYVNWKSNITTDIHSLLSGYYVLYIRLDNDDEYVGYFSK